MTNRKNLLILICIYIIIAIFVVLHFWTKLLEKTAVASFKKLFTEYTQVLDITVNEMDGDTNCYFSTDKSLNNDFSGCDRFYKNFATNLNVRKYCKNNSLTNDCLPLYKNYTTKPDCAGFSENMMNRYDQTFVMQDNSTLTVFNMPSNVQIPIFAIDSNGKPSPNKTGYDLFSLVIMRNKNGQYHFHSNVTHCLPSEKGGIQKLQDLY